MTFDLVRVGWPNTVAILALAIMPLISLAIPEGPARDPFEVEKIDNSTQNAMLTVSQPDEP
jgi:hypothetical protein